MKHQRGVTRITLVGSLVLVGLAGVVALAAGGARSPHLEQKTSVWPTYYQDVRPVLEKNCTGCHVDGGIAPFALTDEKAVTGMASRIADAVKAKRMPPWMPGPDSVKFLHERKLSVADRTAIQDWAIGGARVGTPTPTASANAERNVSSRKPDLTLSMPFAYTPTSKSQDDYRCFLIDPGNAEDRMVTGYRIRPGEASVVHHVIAYKLEGEVAQKAVEWDQKTGGKGWTCFGGPSIPDAPRAGGNWLGAWVPGSSEVTANEGTGIPLPRGTKLVLQMHYNLGNGAKPDRTSLDLFFAPSGAKLRPTRTSLLFAPVELACPKGSSGALCDRDAVIQENTRKYGQLSGLLPGFLLQGCKKTLNDYASVGDASDIPTSCEYKYPATAKPFVLYGIASHMHTRGKASTVELNPGTPDAKVILNIPRWDFNWQGFYQLETPITVKPGDTIRLSCRFDNSRNSTASVGQWTSTESRYVVWGEGTEDEMCLGVMTVGPTE